MMLSLPLYTIYNVIVLYNSLLLTLPIIVPETTKFDPERLASHIMKPLRPLLTYMLFGLDPHVCIGERFAMLQTKIELTYFLRVLNQKVTRDSYAAGSQGDNNTAEGCIYLNVVRSPLCERIYLYCVVSCRLQVCDDQR